VSSFIFGSWTIKGDRIEEKTNQFNFNSFWSVTIAFFIAEIVNKTQLATVTLAAEFNAVFPV
jgi:Ca2+/H+ antiporter, TMEM165/GDT1 family